MIFQMSSSPSGSLPPNPVMREFGTASVLVLSCVVISWSCAEEDPTPRYLADAEALARGRSVFVGTCSGYCHADGVEGVGDAPDLFDCEWRYGRSNQEIFNTISEGVPNSRMIGFGGCGTSYWTGNTL